MRSKLRGRRDANQPLIVERFKQNFVSVADTADLGDDFPDLVLGVPGLNVLCEVKLPGRELEPGQARFRDEWRGPFVVVRTVEEADEIAAKMRLHASKMKW